ncbi:hypothetical protein WJX73_009678 [Symbiochloris irregularis]|uniref:Uncharacterized protein n=1 Tax=Symbiochloris irregularis TaxID=706552 RepID=A0AAW1PVJ9_9CHLO
MGAVFGSCCGGSANNGDSDEGHAPMRSGQTSSQPTAADLDARSRAAEAAEARQAKFDQSAVGKATKKSVANAKKDQLNSNGLQRCSSPLALTDAS